VFDQEPGLFIAIIAHMFLSDIVAVPLPLRHYPAPTQPYAVHCIQS
jgi:hypothetical protein